MNLTASFLMEKDFMGHEVTENKVTAKRVFA